MTEGDAAFGVQNVFRPGRVDLCPKGFKGPIFGTFKYGAAELEQR